MSTITTLIYDLPQLLDRLMEQDERCGGVCSEGRLAPFPPIQLTENETMMQVRALLPGIASGSVSLELANGALVLCGQLPVAKGRYHRHERPSGLFQRVIELPCPVSDAPIDARLNNGVLTVTLPKGSPCLRRSISVCSLAHGSHEGDNR